MPYVVMMRPRDWLGVIAAVSGFPLAAVTVRELGYIAGVPLSVAVCSVVAVLVSWPRARDWIVWPAAAAAVVSLEATATAIGSTYVGGVPAGLVGMLEVGALLVFLALVVRWGPARRAAVVGVVTGVAVSVWILRFLPTSSVVSTIGACAVWALGPIGAATVGGYPRLAARRLMRSVAAARQAQRMELAHDLHDFVAHDVTGIVVQAQAAQYVGASEPVRMLAALKRIEAAGLRALDALDQTVEMLGTDGGWIESAIPAVRRGVPDLPDVIDRFRSELGGAELRLTVALPEHADEIAQPVSATVYRIVMEALTNVRRHAPTAGRVDVRVSVSPEQCLHVLVLNSGGTVAARTLPRARSSSGRGLAGLDDRVRALDGRFFAGPEAGGWVVRAEMPATGHRRAGGHDD